MEIRCANSGVFYEQSAYKCEFFSGIAHCVNKGAGFMKIFITSEVL